MSVSPEGAVPNRMILSGTGPARAQRMAPIGSALRYPGALPLIQHACHAIALGIRFVSRGLHEGCKFTHRHGRALHQEGLRRVAKRRPLVGGTGGVADLDRPARNQHQVRMSSDRRCGGRARTHLRLRAAHADQHSEPGAADDDHERDGA